MSKATTPETAVKVTNNANVTTTSVKQEANDVLGTPEKTLYYLILKNEKGGQMIVNVGQKTHDQVKELTK